MSEGRVLNVGTAGHCDRPTLFVWLDESADTSAEAWAKLEELDVEVVRWDDERVKSFDAKLGFGVSGVLEIREEDREKVLAMFGPPQIPLSTSLGCMVEREVPHVVWADRRGKKGKYKKDWQR